MVTIKLIALILFIFFSNQSYSAQKYQIIRDAEIEFFLHKIIKSIVEEDQSKNFEKNIQKLTDSNIENIEKILATKEKEISQI